MSTRTDRPRRAPLRRSLTQPTAAIVLTLAAAGLGGCAGGGEVAGEADSPVTATPVGDGATRVAPAAPASSPAPPATSPVSPSATSATTPPPLPSPDELAGVLSRTVPDVGDGALTVVPGTSDPPAPDADRVDVAVSAEGGLDVDPQAFAGFVLTTLNDPRSWTRDGYSFARTDTDPDVTVVLASPNTSAALCRPLQTLGTLSCRVGDRVILTWYRWVNGQEDYADDPTGYRNYLVNHEVGHFLGNGHVSCPGTGQPAPVMMQQTKGLVGCTTNSWPYP